MLDLETDAVAASWTVVDDRLSWWRAGLDEVFALVAGEFAQVESRRRARGHLLGLLSGAERKNSWTIAEQAGDVAPDGMQRLLNHYRWDADTLRGYVLEHLAAPGGVVVADETGFLKKGTKSAGVQRQYSGTAGRIENCQLGVFLTYVSPQGRALIDRELYLPEHSWCADRDRCREAGIDDDVEFATKPELARRMLERLLDTGADIEWFTADEAYGDNPGLRAWCELAGLNYVMAISCDTRYDTPASRLRADEVARSAPRTGWQRLSAGEGSRAIASTTHHAVHARRRVPRRHRPPRAGTRRKKGSTTHNEPLIPLSCNEIRRLWATGTRPTHPQQHIDHWSDWRRIHQTRARRSHYQRQRIKHHTLPL